jgi:hypothetical protein
MVLSACRRKIKEGDFEFDVDLAEEPEQRP